MLKQLHKKVIIAVCFCSLLLPVAFANQDIKTTDRHKIQTEFIRKDVKVNDLDIEPINTTDVKNTVVPDVKQEGKKVLERFLQTMLAVLIAAVLINIILLFVKKFYGSAFVGQNWEEMDEELDLTTPNTKQEALSSFLKRTK